MGLKMLLWFCTLHHRPLNHSSTAHYVGFTLRYFGMYGMPLQASEALLPFVYSTHSVGFSQRYIGIRGMQCTLQASETLLPFVYSTFCRFLTEIHWNSWNAIHY